VSAHFLQYVGAGIRIPQTVDVLVSEDGSSFRQVARVKHKQDERATSMETLAATFKGVQGRFVRIVAHTNGQWLFTDEVLVNPEPGEQE
jgi:hypothetical protein